MLYEIVSLLYQFAGLAFDTSVIGELFLTALLGAAFRFVRKLNLNGIPIPTIARELWFFIANSVLFLIANYFIYLFFSVFFQERDFQIGYWFVTWSFFATLLCDLFIVILWKSSHSP